MTHRSITSFLTHDAPDGGAATLAQVVDACVRKGELVEQVEGGAVRCFACGHRCLVRPGRRGICKVRFNKDGTLYVTAGYVAFFFQAEDGIRDVAVTGVQTCALPI